MAHQLRSSGSFPTFTLHAGACGSPGTEAPLRRQPGCDNCQPMTAGLRRASGCPFHLPAMLRAQGHQKHKDKPRALRDTLEARK